MDLNELLNTLTIKEKIKLLSGADFWSTASAKELQGKMMTDGPNGVRKQINKNDMLGFNESEKTICYPTACLSACSFNPELIKKMGECLGHEAASLDVSLILGPGLNIKRSPLGGRNFEYFSEDQLLSGKMAGAFASGIESTGVGACLKHYACNNQEKERFISNSLVDDRTLNELYLKGFEIAIKEAKPTAIMTSYNLTNGTYMCENKELLAKARGFGFSGMFITDWGGLNNPVKSFKNGLNLEMPGTDKKRVKQIYKAYKNGDISLEEINNAITPTLSFLLKEKANPSLFSLEEAKNTALNVATEGIVLLKNDDDILPLKDKKVGVIGSLAEAPRYQGAGSSRINPIECISFIDTLKNEAIDYSYAAGYDDESIYLDEALNVAKNCEKLIVFLGLPNSYESEGFDKDSLALPENQLTLFEELQKVNKNIIVVIQAGSPVELPFKDNTKAILASYLAGAYSGLALYKLIFGLENPSGRLAETWPMKVSDTVAYKSFPEGNKTVHYTEGMYVGYKYYHSLHINVNYPFGYGLSYSKFSYSNIKYQDNRLTLDVTNNGIKGKDVIQVYLENTGKVNYRRLVEFKKIELNKNETKTISFDITDDMFSMYDVKEEKFITCSGEFTLELGTSSKDIYFKEVINKDGNTPYIIPEVENNVINDRGYTKKINLNSTISEIKTKKLGAFIYRFIDKKLVKLMKENPKEAKMIEVTMKEMPLRSLAMGTNGIVNCYKIQGLIDLLNGNILKGLRGLLK